MSAPDELPRGEFWATRFADGSFRIDRADPRILIGAELVGDIADHPRPQVWLDTSGCDTYIGALLRLTGVNRRVIYRLTSWVPGLRCFLGEWPD